VGNKFRANCSGIEQQSLGYFEVKRDGADNLNLPISEQQMSYEKYIL
jgi:hypothetical protein